MMKLAAYLSVLVVGTFLVAVLIARWWENKQEAAGLTDSDSGDD